MRNSEASVHAVYTELEKLFWNGGWASDFRIGDVLHETFLESRNAFHLSKVVGSANEPSSHHVDEENETSSYGGGVGCFCVDLRRLDFDLGGKICGVRRLGLDGICGAFGHGSYPYPGVGVGPHRASKTYACGPYPYLDGDPFPYPSSRPLRTPSTSSS